MHIARNLCLYRQRSEPDCFIPDPGGFPRPHQPRRPHLFTEQEILRVLEATDDLPPHAGSPLRQEVFRFAVVLLYTAGLRRGELVRLTLADYDPAERTLRIRATKFHKSRLVPLSPDAAREMEDYLQARRRLPYAADTPLLCNRSRGLRPYTGAGFAQGLRQLFRRADIKTTSGELPRVHDLRHSFAHQALLRWYRAGDDVQAKLPALATYMGHVSIVSTQHYLALLEPFAQEASARFARHCEPFLAFAPPGDAR
jgi:integrase